MAKKSSIRPAQPTSVASLIALTFMLLFGIGFALLVGNVLQENEAPLIMSLVFLLFMIGWIGTALYLLVYHIRNIRRPEGLPLFEVETESGSSGLEGEPNFARKLRHLEQLKTDGLISQEEYSRKRSEVMSERW
ncbi:MAG: SHOCT domain-containing protein [Geobacteraceae bacterium]|nr:SHOCT domain-containing protein [Geobacteraceae bacterium]